MLPSEARTNPQDFIVVAVRNDPTPSRPARAPRRANTTARVHLGIKRGVGAGRGDRPRLRTDRGCGLAHRGASRSLRRVPPAARRNERRPSHSPRARPARRIRTAAQHVSDFLRDFQRPLRKCCKRASMCSALPKRIAGPWRGHTHRRHRHRYRFGASGSQGARCRAPQFRRQRHARLRARLARNSGCRRHRGAREQPRGHRRHRAARATARLQGLLAQCQGCPAPAAILFRSLRHWSRPTNPVSTL